jgi:hypothetical protein
VATFQHDQRASDIELEARRATSHREMPNLVLKNDEIDNLAAYIATLK